MVVDEPILLYLSIAPKVTASYIRVYPLQAENYVAVRLEIYGQPKGNVTDM